MCPSLASSWFSTSRLDKSLAPGGGPGSVLQLLEAVSLCVLEVRCSSLPVQGALLVPAPGRLLQPCHSQHGFLQQPTPGTMWTRFRREGNAWLSEDEVGIAVFEC